MKIEDLWRDLLFENLSAYKKLPRTDSEIEGVGMNEDKLKERTINFAHQCVKLALSINSSILGNHLAKQLIRCSTSVAANYRSACIAHSKASFIAKLSIVLEEIDESSFWLEFINEERLLPSKSIKPLLKEAGELKAIFYTSRKTARSKK